MRDKDGDWGGLKILGAIIGFGIFAFQMLSGAGNNPFIIGLVVTVGLVFVVALIPWKHKKAMRNGMFFVIVCGYLLFVFAYSLKLNRAYMNDMDYVRLLVPIVIISVVLFATFIGALFPDNFLSLRALLRNPGYVIGEAIRRLFKGSDDRI
jgi:NhaP-type Na+/H+ or K+/H+ antiporter